MLLIKENIKLVTLILNEGNIKKGRPPIDIDTNVAANHQVEDEEKPFLPKKKCYTRYSRLYKFEQATITFFLNFWMNK